MPARRGSSDGCACETVESLAFPVICCTKLANSAGLRLADLTARPIGLFVMRPEQPNRTYEILNTKFRKCSDGGYEGYGLKIV